MAYIGYGPPGPNFMAGMDILYGEYGPIFHGVHILYDTSPKNKR